MTNEVKAIKITNHEKVKYGRNCGEWWEIFLAMKGTWSRIFWEQGNSVKVNFGEQVHSFLSNKGTTVNFYREQGNMHQPPPPPLPPT